MIFWDLIDKIKSRPELFDVIDPKNIESLPDDMYYIVKVVRFFPDKESCTRQYGWQVRFKTKKPILTKTLLTEFESKLRIKITEL